MVIFKMLAPKIFPTPIEVSFLIIAVTEVTSSGKEVPSATKVTPTTLSGTPSATASREPLCTNRRAPIMILAAPKKNLHTFHTICFLDAFSDAMEGRSAVLSDF